MDLADRVALVIGGAAGMGLASSRALAADGATVVIADRDFEAAESAASDIRTSGGQAVAHRVDAGSLDALAALFDFVGTRYGRLNVLFSNVGITGPDGFDVTEAQFDEAFNINLKSHFFATKFAVPLMRPCASRASIIYMSSAGALRAAGRSPLYNLSKASILMMMRTFARNLGPEGIRVNALCPGHVETDFPRRWLGLDEDEYQARIRKRGETIPLRRVGQPEDVANVVAFLASDKSSYLTGLSIPIDGGETA